MTPASSKLMSPLCLTNADGTTTTLRNRLIMGSMHTGLEELPDGWERLAAFYAERAAGGAVPRYLPITIADRSVGLYAFGVISAALYARSRTGRGQSVEIPMFETMVPYVLGDHLYGHTFVPPQGGFGYPRIMSPNRRPYRTADGYVCCLVYTDKHWKTFLTAAGKPELLVQDPRLRDIGTRTANIDALYQLVADELLHKTTAQWQQQLAEADIPVFPMHDFDSLLDDEHLADIGFFREVDHPAVGRILDMAVPSEWSGTPPAAQARLAPTLGQHTDELLAEAGYSPEQILALRSCGAAG